MIELLLVVVTLGVLAGLVTLASDPFREGVTKAACESTLRTLHGAAGAYEARLGHYPGSMAELVQGGFLKDYPEGTSPTTDGDFIFVTDSPPTSVTRPC